MLLRGHVTGLPKKGDVTPRFGSRVPSPLLGKAGRDAAFPANKMKAVKLSNSRVR
jgi:hypothetical protein